MICLRYIRLIVQEGLKNSSKNTKQSWILILVGAML